MNKFNMFIAAVCILFLIKLRFPTSLFSDFRLHFFVVVKTGKIPELAKTRG